MATQPAHPGSQTPIPRTRPVNTSSSSRQSNALRASVLDAALELGIGSNSVVSAWMFNNTLQEEEEEEESVASPRLTQSPSTASDDSYRHPITPPSNETVSSRPFPSTAKPEWNPNWPPADSVASRAHTSDQPSASTFTGIAFPTTNDIPIPPRPTTPSKKLRKKAKDGNESDGGYLSETAKAVKKKESKARLKEEKEEERKRKKSLGNAKSSKKGDRDDGGNETDGGAIASSSSKSPFKKSKAKKSKEASMDGGAGYETDAGYVSAGANVKKPKTRFFKLSLKSSRGDLKGGDAAAQVPPMPKDLPPREPLVLPIAERFATSLNQAGSKPPPSKPPPSASMELPFEAPSSFASPSNPDILPFKLPDKDPRLELPSIAAHQPMSFDDVVPSVQPTHLPSASSVSSVPSMPSNDRTSLSSAESSTSSQTRRRALQFSPRDVLNGMANPSHSAGAPSISTINSTNNSSIHGSAGHSGLASPSSFQDPTSPKSSKRMSSSSGQSSLRAPPTISFPLTRAASPAPPVSPISPLNIPKHNHHHPGQLAQLDVGIAASGGGGPSRGASPLPMSPHSPYVMVTPSVSQNPSPTRTEGLLAQPPQSTANRAPSPIPAAAAATPVPGQTPVQVPMQMQTQSPVRPRNPPTDGFGPRVNTSNLISPPLTAPTTTNGRLSPNPIRGRRLSPLLAPQNGQDDDDATLPSPNVLAYYDIPPPSPPPMGPLPSVPPSQLAAAGVGAGAAPLAQLRAKRLGAELGVPAYNQNIQRGRESPFPARPVIPVASPPASSANQYEAGPQHRGNPAAYGYEVRPLKHTRFEEGIPSPVPRPPVPRSQKEAHWEHERGGYSGLAYDAYEGDEAYDETEVGEIESEGGYDDDEDDARDIRGVLDRYTDSSHEGHGSFEDEPLAARRSFEVAAKAAPSSSSKIPPVDTEIGVAIPRPQPISRPPPNPPVDPKHDSFAVSEYYGRERDTVYSTASYAWEEASGEGGGNRESRWSGSIYSRVSIMEPDQSGQTRDRFVQRVEAMMRAEREREGAVPPVPAIPAGLANAGSWNRF